MPDVNLLIYAYNTSAPQHQRASDWWEQQVATGQQVAVSWPVMQGFVRLMSGRSLLAKPYSPKEVFQICQEWLDHNVLLLGPSAQTWTIFRNLTEKYHLVGSATSDALIAAFAVEHRARLATNDTDFARFKELRTLNPL